MKPMLVALLAVLLLAGLGWAIWSGSEPGFDGNAQPAPPETQESVSAQAGESSGDAEVVAEETTPGMAPARRVKGGKASAETLANARVDINIEDKERQDQVDKQFKDALAGDIDALITIARAISECGRVGGSEERLQRRLDRASRWFSNAGEAGLPNRGSNNGSSNSSSTRSSSSASPAQFQSMEDYEANAWETFDQCQLMADSLDEDLHDQIADLADSGHPSARYLYAMWPPDQDVFEPADTLKLLDYQTRALEYTWANLEERNPLGVLAMSQSYNAWRPTLFTPVNMLQGQVFTLASMKCGIDNEWLEERSLSFGQGWSRWQAENTTTQTLDGDAEAIVEMFCPRSASKN